MTKSILIVEDEKLVAETLSDILELLGYNVTITSNGEEGLKKFKKEKFDLIITDIHMPKLDGFQLVKKIRASDKEIPILALSGFIDSEHIQKILDMGADGYIEKPFTIAKIKSALKQFI
jgi:CheY-like chemotaxis protein